MSPFRVFIASPSDVMEERGLVSESLSQFRCERMFRDTVNIQDFSWYQAGSNTSVSMGISPHQAISNGLVLPSECDLAVFILWSRMGVALPPEYAKPDGSPYLSVTEWEYWDAINGYKENGRPKVWIYLRTGPPVIHLDDPQILEKREQYNKLQQFLSSIRNEDGTSILGISQYESVDNFRDIFEIGLRKELTSFLRTRDAANKSGLDSGEKNRDQKSKLGEASGFTSAANWGEPKPRLSDGSMRTRVSPKANPNLDAFGHDRYPPEFPPSWAIAWGDDRFGLWAEFRVGEVVQRMRWIEPGEFLMGSPEDEPERSSDEGPRHRVRLSEGFWLADSACTQELWLAVIEGKNPSHFQNDFRCPVEQVSWDDVQEFLRALLDRLPAGAEPILPTESQWEYACRAGTDTPFSFGERITPEQVNFDGNYPYVGSVKGRYRQRTVPVKSLPPNRWGLYEMHGNILEWCSDSKREYKAASEGYMICDPEFPPGRESPALRGGAWFHLAKFVRSACRQANERGTRHSSVGFRLALRSTSTSPAGPEDRK